MRNKKSDEPEKSAEEIALTERVDAMMDPKRPTKAPLEPGVEESAHSETDGESIKVSVKLKPKPTVEAATITPNDQSTAPPLSAKLLKQLPKDEPAAKPLSIDKLDALTGGVAEAVPETSTAEAAVESKSNKPEAKSTELDDTATDKAVDDIVAKEGDTILALEDARTARLSSNSPRRPAGWKARLRRLLKDKWTWLGVAVLLLVIFGLPVTRYKLLGLVLKKPVALTVLDSKTRTPVSSAEVRLNGKTGKTDGSGRLHLTAPVGRGWLVITKKYYQTSETIYFVGFKAAPPSKINLVATGRLVPVSVINKITGKPLTGAVIQALGTSAKTDGRGRANIALPANDEQVDAIVKLAGYNQSKVSLQVTDQTVKANRFELTPGGHIYFLSNLNGSLDVIKSNLDGSDRQTVVPGTGREEKATTSLLASSDWRYLVLKARRDSDQPALYLLDTGNDKLMPFETGNATFKLVGWYGHNFIYDLTRASLADWQAGREVIKSYDAENKQPNQLDQNQAEGDAGSYAYQNFANFYVAGGAVVYNTSWIASYAAGTSHDLSGKSNTIRSAQPSGQGKKDYQPLPADSASYNRAVLYEPGRVYYETYSKADTKTSYYTYEDQAVKPATGIDQTSFNQNYPTFLISPSGNQSFWTDLRDGKNTLFTGDAGAKNAKRIASLSAYAPYGWYTDTYTLLSKNGSELYIMPASGLDSGTRPPLKITNYYKSAQTYAGYGYGGL